MSYKSNQEKMIVDSNGIVESVAAGTASTLITDLGSNNFRVNFSSRIIKELTSADFELVGCTISSIVNNNQDALVTFSLTATAASYSVKVISDVLSEFSESNTVSLTDIATVSLNSGVAQEIDRVRFTATFNYPVTQTLTSSMVSASSGTITNFSKAVDNLSVTFDVTTSASSFTVKTLAVSGATKESNLVSKSATNYWYSSSFNANLHSFSGYSVAFRTLFAGQGEVVKAGAQSGVAILDYNVSPLVDGSETGAQNLYYSGITNFSDNYLIATFRLYNSGPGIFSDIPAGNKTYSRSNVVSNYMFDLRNVSGGSNYTGQFLVKLRTLGY